MVSSIHLNAMTSTECHDFLSRMNYGHLACLANEKPYIVPIHFVFHSGSIYSFSRTGTKIDCMRSNPNVCLQVEEVQGIASWQSVVIQGIYLELPDSEQWHSEHIYAWSLIQKRPNWWEPASFASDRTDADPAAQKPVFFSIQKETMSGRRTVQNEDVTW
jgi:nitroimidazol reductase NimA-like FMN-containing flavoprotein (pyridoxamine 5'-phosphate oxidase superfamily)